jgi:hypothetical protein
MSVSKTALVGAFLLGCGVVFAADEEVPDPEFLEYLGLWEESDEDWLIFDEPVTAETDERSDPASEGEESPEKTDES